MNLFVELMALVTTSGYLFVLLLGVFLSWRTQFKAGVWAFAILLLLELFGVAMWPQVSDSLLAIVQEGQLLSIGQVLSLYASLNSGLKIVAYALLAVGLYRKLMNKQNDREVGS